MIYKYECKRKYFFRNEIENKNYVEQLRSLQIAILAARSPSSVLSEEVSYEKIT